MNILAYSASERTSSTALAAFSSRGSTAAAAVASSTETTRSSVIIDFTGGRRSEEKPRLPPREQLSRLLDTLGAQLDDARAKLGGADQAGDDQGAGDADKDDATKGAADANATLQQGSGALDRLDFVLTSLKLILADKSTGLGTKIGLIGFLSNVANGQDNTDAAKQAFGEALDGILARADKPPGAEAAYRDLLGTFATDPAAATTAPPAPSGEDGGSQTLFSRLDRVSETTRGLVASADENGGSEAVYERTREVLSGFSVRVEDGKLAIDFFRQERVTESAAAQAYAQGGQEPPGTSRSAEA